MKVYNRLKSGFINKDYYISVSNNNIYIMNYKSIVSFDDKLIKILFNKFMLIVSGCNFKIIRKSNIEIEVLGIFSKMEIENEI